MSLGPDSAAQVSLAADARKASAAQALAARVAPGQNPQNTQSPKIPEKAFGKILDSLTPEKAEAAGASPEVVKTLTGQAMNKRLSPGPSEEKKARDACEGFEAVFIGQMIKEMRKTVPKDGMLHGKHEDEYVSMFDEELSKTLTKQGGIGLADFMQRQLALGASSKKQQASPESQAGLRRTASESVVTAPVNKVQANGLRGRLFNQLRPSGLSGGQSVVLAADAVRPGTPPGPYAPVSAAPKQTSPGSLQGTPSQHMGLPGAQYLKGADVQLAATGVGAVAPVEGELTSEFGWRKDPFTGQRAWHNGVDIAAAEGTPVKSWRDGNVVFSGKMHGYGNLVVVEHADGVKSFYGHNKANSVAVGQAVKAGQVIAQVGQTGRATGPHLHFEVRVNDSAVNPSKLGGSMLAAAPEPERMIPDL
ncbi:MAG: peptidoglycan DD-metalloendopeptidase family protein [Desulfovibrio sp.]|nr:peptidoglycan DD-metalloendopeptidase family protein [Desulfovibrio sp.]